MSGALSANITSRDTFIDVNDVRSYDATFVNHRKTSGGYQGSVDTHDAAGNVTLNTITTNGTNTRTWTFDAAGRMTDWLEILPIPDALHWHRDEGATYHYDGDGRSVKKVSRTRERYLNQTPPYTEEIEHSIISSVTGKTITTLFYVAEVSWHKTNIHMGSSVIAEYSFQEGETSELIFKHADPITGSSNRTLASGVGGNDPIELEPLGARANPDPNEIILPEYGKGGSVFNPESGCQIDYGPVSCSFPPRARKKC